MERLKTEIPEPELKLIENREIIIATKKDREWWGIPERRFPDNGARDKAIENGDLVRVEIPNIYFTAPSDIRNDQNLQLLRPEAMNFLYRVCRELDEAIGYSKSGNRLAIISMYRNDTSQQDILNCKSWYRAVQTGRSSHAAGAAFDISIRSHYVLDSTADNLLAVNSWDKNASKKYQPIIFEILGEILASYAHKNVCNLVVENHVLGDYYEPTAFHVCISPKITNILKNE